MRKLYVKGKCTICREKVLGCPYCDSEGFTFVEASDKLIAEIISQADEELKQLVLQEIGVNYEAVINLSSSFIAD